VTATRQLTAVALPGAGTRTAYPRAAAVHEVFAVQASRTPDAVAVVADGLELRYGELDASAARVAGALRARGVAVGARVGLYADRGVHALVGMLGILNAGGAYVPLDPADPDLRTSAMLADAEPDVVLTPERLRERLSAAVSGDRLVSIEDALAESGPVSGGERVPATSLAYIMYTSGSTGTPKGVCVPHRAIIRLVVNTDFVRLAPDEVVLHLAPLTFDASTFEVWGSLLNGARLVVLPSAVPSVAEIAAAIARHRVTTLWLPAGLFRRLVEDDAVALSGVRQVVTGGDVVDPRAVRRALAALTGLTVINGYGPTEGTTFSCAYPMTCGTPPIGSSVPIGRPIANTRAYVLDEDLAPLPPGATGELYIGGDGVALGYLHRPALTAAAFVPDPFADAPGAVLYRTGDRARVRDDGNLEFLGRVDRQVKIRGFRVELGELEATLAAHPSVREATCAARSTPAGEQELVAYVSPRGDRGTAAPDVTDRWREVYDEVIYAGLNDQATRPRDPTLNTLGWNDSYTGLPIPERAMQEQVEQTVARILERRPERMLEIGCGTGMLLFRLVPHCRRYVGIDFSEVALDYVRSHLPGRTGACSVRLVHGDASDLAAVANERFDAIVLNSVIQHFASAGELRAVLEGAIELVDDGGLVFIGDVRSRALLRLFHASVAWSRADGSLPMRQLVRQVEQRVADEQELAVDPEFFLATGLPRVTAVRANLKRGVHENELTRYRYDVLLDIGMEGEVVEPTRSLRWGREIGSPADLSRLLEEGRRECLSVRGVANRRSARDRWLLERLAAPWVSETVADVRAAVPVDVTAGSVDPEDVWALAEALRYRVEVEPARGAADGSFDAVFFRRDDGKEGLPVTAASVPAGEGNHSRWRELTNTPLVATGRGELTRELRTYVQSRLPSHMVPSFFVVMESLPKTTAGKVDVASLPPPEPVARSRAAPLRRSDPTVAALAALWERLLGVEAVQREESFFELGGNSLLVIQLVHLIEQELAVQISPVAVFEQPTLRGLARLIDGATDGRLRE